MKNNLWVCVWGWCLEWNQFNTTSNTCTLSYTTDYFCNQEVWNHRWNHAISKEAIHCIVEGARERFPLNSQRLHLFSQIWLPRTWRKCSLILALGVSTDKSKEDPAQQPGSRGMVEEPSWYFPFLSDSFLFLGTTLSPFPELFICLFVCCCCFFFCPIYPSRATQPPCSTIGRLRHWKKGSISNTCKRFVSV